MKRRSPDWIGHGAIAVVLLSAGIVIGTTFRSRAPRPTGIERPDSALPGRRPLVKPESASATEDREPTPVVRPAIPSAPGFEPFETGEPAPAFGGEYAVLRGAEGVGAPPRPASPDGVAFEAARAEPAGGTPEDGGEVETTLSARSRPSPAQGIPRGIAMRIPLLGISRPGGRVVFHDLGGHDGPAPSGIEGEWAVLGRCERIVRVEFGLPAHSFGELRAIGRSGGDGWGVEPVVPRQACEAASERFVRPHAATAAERAALAGIAAGEPGAAALDMAEVMRIGPAILVVFRNASGAATVVAATSGGGGYSVRWSKVVEPGDGGLWLLGVYRMGSGAVAWLSSGPRDAPRMMYAVTSTDLGSWTLLHSAPLRER